MVEATLEDLRDIVAREIEPTIKIHRASRAGIDGSAYEAPDGPPTDEEISEFLFHVPTIDEDDLQQMIDPGFLGFSARQISIDEEWLADFERGVRDWANNNSWLGADTPWRFFTQNQQPLQSEIWTPEREDRPLWLDSTPSCVVVAQELLRKGQLLSDLPWRHFEELIGSLLESEGWIVEITRGTRDGGIDVIASVESGTLGSIRSIWQAKKYAPTNKVQLHEVRELSGVLETDRATKGVMVTTSKLTRGAIEWIRRDRYRLDFMEGGDVRMWLERATFG